MAHGRLSPQQYTILGLVAISAPLGDSCLARGMSTLPAISLAQPLALIAAVFTPWIAAGIALLICFFACYLTALSWADLTYVLPTTAFGYVFIALLGRFWLHEQISPYRWTGILLITLGVGFVAQGPAITVKEPDRHLLPEESEEQSAFSDTLDSSEHETGLGPGLPQGPESLSSVGVSAEERR